MGLREKRRRGGHGYDEGGTRGARARGDGRPEDASCVGLRPQSRPCQERKTMAMEEVEEMARHLASNMAVGVSSHFF